MGPLNISPLCYQVLKLQNISFEKERKNPFKMMPFPSAGKLQIGNTSEGSGTVVYTNGRFFCLTAAHVLPENWKTTSLSSSETMTFNVNGGSYTLLPPQQSDIIYNDICDIALLPIKSDTNKPPLIAAKLTLEQPSESWMVQHHKKVSIGASILRMDTGSIGKLHTGATLRPTYCNNKISTASPGRSGSGLITRNRKVWAIHRHRDKDPFQLSTGYSLVGVRKEGCSLNAVWDEVCSQTTSLTSNLYTLLLPLANHLPTIDYASGVLDDITILRSNGSMNTWYQQENKGLPVINAKPFFLWKTLKKHYSRGSFLKHAEKIKPTTLWGDSQYLTVFRLGKNCEEALKELTKTNGPKVLKVSSYVTYNKDFSIRKSSSPGKPALISVGVENNKIMHVYRGVA
ncbi:hypothetical protein DID80_07450 [Candidatus Marinamargulisbacteria bacterium SCGC AAA071-K20]|nr:hypothetical protein DID80_07450 [Candidatus Marinamargulisbacteria bacterium SCGC AAA071-K20]